MMGDDDKPFACPEVGCRMRFTNEDHLMVHRMKHEMSLPLTPGLKPGQLLTFADQTPTPTRFLRNCEEIGLFNELKSNPFEEAFKKASEFIEPDGKSTEQPGQTSAVADTTVVCDNLNTPTPLLAPRNPPASPALAATTTQLLAAPSASFVPLPGPNKEVGSTVTPTSPVTIDQNAEVTVDSPVLCSSELPVVPPHDSNSLPQKTVISAVSAAPTTAAITTNVTAITTALSLSRAAVTTKAPSSVGVAGTSAVPRVLATGVPQYMLQVMVQMPSGDMVPVQIPAAPAPLAQSNLPAAVVSITTSVAPSTTVASAPLTTVATTAAAPLSTKQILKAVLQQQSMKVTNEDSDSVKATYQVSPPARTLVNRVGRSQTLVRSPVTLPTISVTSPVMMTSPSGASPSVMSPRLQVHDVDTSTPLKRSRSSSPEEDSDERRRKFLERNRAAAARCRAKKKMWIGGLEKKADDMQDVNARLQLEVTQLRNEVAELKSLLLAHKDCPITLQQRNAGRLTFTTVTPKVEPPDHPAMDISGATETSESTHDSVSHVTVTTSTVGSTSSQPIILNIMPLVQDGS